MIEKSKNFILKISLFYTAIFFLFIAIPTYFYTNLEIENYKNTQNRALVEYAQKIQRAIYDFSNSKSDTFIFPKSFKIEATLLDKNRKILYKTRNLNFKSTKKINFEMELSKNRLNAKYLTLSKNVYYKEVYLKILILSLCIGLFIFISIYLLIKASIEPYKKANEYLDAFFNDAMHELKTPLGVIQLNLEILQEKQKDTKEIQRSINATKNLFLVYEDIEYLIKQKSVKYNKENIDFSYLLNQRVDQFESLSIPKNIKFNLNIENNISISINRTHLQRIIDNTISNAIKYSFKDTIVSINLYRDTQRNSIVFSVHNYANPIINKKTIFNRYYKENHIKGGFGIGLNIVKNICEANNIEIFLESTKETGTTFKYTFLINS
ncbi:two-component sensor histidine kinase [Halarcobacter mediterraneus]|uniref:histidine kinase n=1 Tax=Halarcobacter mediterraneus TaxID=2023153 RepID=A0A4V1M1I6_9BACT|nr:HAMP domain-containing sensor histidine kinase [Halarcobacter mediterraneus]RXK14006.1 two-component sensor histidine kinase [Halarcobacter mediterraneus]